MKWYDAWSHTIMCVRWYVRSSHTIMCVTWLIHTCEMTHYHRTHIIVYDHVYDDMTWYVTHMIVCDHVCDMTHSHVRNNSIMCDVTHSMCEMTPSYDWVRSHIWMGHVTHTIESCPHEWFMSHRTRYLFKRISCSLQNESRHVWLCHITHKRVASHIQSRHYGVASIRRLLKMIRLFCRISSLLYGSFAKETYNSKEPTDRSHRGSLHMECQTSIPYDQMIM